MLLPWKPIRRPSAVNALLNTCTGLNAHITHSLDSRSGAATPLPGYQMNDQQPETLEALLYMYGATHNATYRDWAWQIFRGFEMWGRVGESGGYAGLEDATAWPTPRQSNVQWRWWMAECLKYLWLIFGEDDVLPLDQYVFNTVAHPFSVAHAPAAQAAAAAPSPRAPGASVSLS